MDNEVRKKTDYIFWLTLIFYSNPGGLQQSLGIYEPFGRINLNDFLFIILSICFMLIPNTIKYKQRSTKNITISFVVFIMYYLLIFGYITPLIKNNSANVIYNFIKMRHVIYSFAIFFYAYVFWKRSYRIFVRIFISSSIIILLIYLQSFITKINILPLVVMSRRFIDADRYFLISYGFMPILTIMGVIVLIFQHKNEFSKKMIVGMILINISWIISLTRRDIISLILTIILGYLLYNYVKKSNLKYLFKLVLRIVSIAFILFILLRLSVPSYINATVNVMESSLHVIKYGEDISGQKDERLNIFGRKKIMEEFKKSPLFGTGFNNLWRTSEGDKQGYESSDYPFQSALAMAGIVGCLMFLPIYIFLIKMLIHDITKLRKGTINTYDIHQMFLLIFILHFSFQLLQYINWFGPVAMYSALTFYLYLAFYLATRELYYSKKKNNKDIHAE